MSYYTYFYLKEEVNKEKYSPSKTLFKNEYEAKLLALIYEGYNNGINDKLLTTINTLLIGIFYDEKDKAIYDILSIIEEDDDDHAYTINHCHSKYDMEEIALRIDNLTPISESLLDLISLMSVKYVENCNKESETLHDYLFYEFRNKFKTIIEDFKENVYECSKYKFLLENCTSKTEDEL